MLGPALRPPSSKLSGTRLEDILRAISLIARYADRGRPGFDRDELVQAWMVHHLTLIGEAAALLSPALRDRHPEVPWPVIGMRDVLVHGYFSIDLDEVWATVERHGPVLRSQIAIGHTLYEAFDARLRRPGIPRRASASSDRERPAAANDGLAHHHLGIGLLTGIRWRIGSLTVTYRGALIGAIALMAVAGIGWIVFVSPVYVD